MAGTLYVGDPNLPSIGGWESWPEPLVSVGPTDVPSIAQVQQAEILVVLGQIADGARAQQLSGVVRLALSSGLLLVVGYPAVIEEGLNAFLSGLDVRREGRLVSARGVRSLDTAFDAYFTVYGRSIEYFETHDEETLGTVPSDHEPLPTALRALRFGGTVYVVPFFLAGANAQFLTELYEAVHEHHEGSATTAPAFLAELRLPGEQDVLGEIAGLETQLDELRARASALERWRLLLGPAGTGAALESLVIEALNVVLAGTGHTAEDRVDIRAEDFWIVGPDGDFALAEVKGQNSHVRRDDVNQVDSHREELTNSVEFPGLLIVNILRGLSRLDLPWHTRRLVVLRQTPPSR